MKLYFNSYNQTPFENSAAVINRIETDISNATRTKVKVVLHEPHQFDHHSITNFSGTCLDDLDISVAEFQPSPQLLSTAETQVNECVFSRLLKSNCLVTGQPDWGTIFIHYVGRQINHENLLRYIVSFRKHNEFHEQCVERIFMDISKQCSPEKLTVYARYTRRGGIDINPFRSNFEMNPINQRLARQ